jgi:hypothetical protein
MTLQMQLLCVQSLLGSPSVDSEPHSSTILTIDGSRFWNPDVSKVWLSNEAQAIWTGTFLPILKF